MMVLLQLGHVTNGYGFISTSINPITTKLGKLVDKYGLTL